MEKKHKKDSPKRKRARSTSGGLSQEEIDVLLAAVDAGNVAEEFRPSGDTRKIKFYDFRRPDKFSKKQIRAIQILHEKFCRLCSELWSSRLKEKASIHVACVDQMTWEDFTRSIPVPSVLPAIDAGEDRVLMEIDPSVSFAIINRMYGGEATISPVRRELTDLESIVIEDLVLRSLSCLRESWCRVTDFRPKLNSIEANPQFCTNAPPNEMCVLVTCEVRIGDAEGMMNICYPASLLAGVSRNLSSLYLPGGDFAAKKKKLEFAGIDEIPVNLIVEILRRKYSVGEICNWREGKIILPFTPRKTGAGFIRAGNYRIWECAINQKHGWFSKSVTIEKICDEPFRSEEKMKILECGNSLVGEALQNAMITISVELGSVAMPVKEILQMKEGTILELDRLAGEPVDIKANGVLIAKGEVVVIDEAFGVRITETGNADQEFGKEDDGEKDATFQIESSL